MYGVPFQFMPTVGKDKSRTMRPTRSVHALPERADSEISFPRVAGYRLEIHDPELFEEFTERSRLTLDTNDIPTETVVGGLDRRDRAAHPRRTAGQARPGDRLRPRAPDHDLVRRRTRPASLVLPAGAPDHQAMDGPRFPCALTRDRPRCPGQPARVGRPVASRESGRDLYGLAGADTSKAVAAAGAGVLDEHRAQLLHHFIEVGKYGLALEETAGTLAQDTTAITRPGTRRHTRPSRPDEAGGRQHGHVRKPITTAAARSSSTGR